MVQASFQVEDKLEKARFFHETFLLADLSIEVVLQMPFLIFNNADIKFAQKKLTWRSYTTAEALLIIKQVEIIDKKEFARAALDENLEAFVLHMTSFSFNSILIQLARKAQKALLIAKKVKIPTNYLDFLDIFSEKKALVLPKITELNQHAIELQVGQQLLYGLIYSLDPIELEMLKIYIETNLANGFIWSSKSPTGALILYVRKPDKSLRLCINYRGLNNLIIKN